MRAGVVVAGLALCIVLPRAEGSLFTFTKIADTDTLVPGTNTRFTGFSRALIDDDTVVFNASPLGDPGGWFGIYSSSNGQLSTLADVTTPDPGGGGNFKAFTGGMSLAEDSVVFKACGAGCELDRFGTGDELSGVYAFSGGSLSVIADHNTHIPDGTGTFTFVSNVAFDGTTAVFQGGGELDQRGIYSFSGSPLSAVVDKSTPDPDRGGTFIDFDQNHVRGGTIVFDSRDTLYTVPAGGGTPTLVVNRDTLIPGGTGTFTQYLDPLIDGDTIAFRGVRARRGERRQFGVYLATGHSVEVVVDTDTPIPEFTGTFNAFDELAFEDGHVTFQGYDAPSSVPGRHEGLYTTLLGELTKIIDVDDLLDDKAIAGFLPLYGEWFYDKSFAFSVRFRDGSQGVYRADLAAAVPEPSTLALVAIGLAGMGFAGRRKLAE